LKNEDSSRRRFIRRLVGLAAVGGIGALLHERLTGKTLMPSVHAADLVIDADNTGTGTTELRSRARPLIFSSGEIALRQR